MTFDLFVMVSLAGVLIAFILGRAAYLDITNPLLDKET